MSIASIAKGAAKSASKSLIKQAESKVASYAFDKVMQTSQAQSLKAKAENIAKEKAGDLQQKYLGDRDGIKNIADEKLKSVTSEFMPDLGFDGGTSEIANIQGDFKKNLSDTGLDSSVSLDIPPIETPKFEMPSLSLSDLV